MGEYVRIKTKLSHGIRTIANAGVTENPYKPDVAEGHPMNPHIDGTQFGSITVKGTEYSHDIVIRLNGEIEKRKKKLSKAVHGTSHIVSRDEAVHLLEDGAELLIVGTGQHGALRVSKEASGYLAAHGCRLILEPTPSAIRHWNRAGGATIAMFHITC